MRILSYVLLLTIILLGIGFAVLNPHSLEINYYIGHRILPLSLVLALSFALGGLVGLCAGFWLLLKMKIKNYRLKQQLKIAEKEIENLRAIPLQDRH